MKKLILNMLLLFVIATAANAQATDPVPMAVTPSTQPENNALLYNPSQNDYSNEMYRSYWVWDNRSAQWVRRVELVGPITPVIIVPNPVTNGNNIPNSNTSPVMIKPRPGGQ